MRHLFYLAVLTLVVGCGTGSTPPEDRIYGCNEKALLKHLRQHGYSYDFISSTENWQNAAGTAIFIAEPAGRNPTEVWMIQSGGRDVVRQSIVRGDWIDGTGNVRKKPAFVGDRTIRIDRQSGYFVMTDDASRMLRLGHFEHPHDWLGEFSFDPAQLSLTPSIRAAGGHVILQDPSGRDGHACLILTPDATQPGGWRKKERRIHAWFLVADPFASRILVATDGMLPFKPCYLAWYNIDTDELVKFNRFIDRPYFVLASDFLSSRLGSQ